MKKQNDKQPKQQAEQEQNYEELQQQINDLTSDLQRVRADFENFRKRTEQERVAARQNGETAMIRKLLPVIDTIDRAIRHTPKELEDNSWVKGVVGIEKNLDKILDGLQIKRIDASEGVEFNPEFHEAIQVDEDAEGETEIIAEELQSGYLQNGAPIRHAMVKVTRR